MLDIDFLRGDPKLKQLVTYTVNTRLHLPQIRAIVRTHAQQKGFMYREVDYGNFMYAVQETPLFGEPFLEIDIAKFREVNKEGATGLLQQLYKALLEKKITARLFIIAPHDDGLKDDANWVSVQKQATNLTEPEVTSGQLPKLLEYLTRTSTLYDFTKLTNLPALEAALREMLDNQPLHEFYNLFERLTLLCISPATNLFDTTEFRRLVGVDTQKDYYALHKHLAAFLHTPTPASAGQLLREVDKLLHLEQMETRAVATMLHKAWRELTTAALTSQKETTVLDWTPYKLRRLRELAALTPDRLLKWGLLWSSVEPQIHLQNPLTVLQDLTTQIINTKAS